jgi:hypothetical protein
MPFVEPMEETLKTGRVLLVPLSAGGLPDEGFLEQSNLSQFISTL